MRGWGGSGISREDLKSDSADEVDERRGAKAIRFEVGENAAGLSNRALSQHKLVSEGAREITDHVARELLDSRRAARSLVLLYV